MASPPAETYSPTSSNGSIWDRQPTLGKLVTHFVASKRSLSSTTHVWRANEIVNSARTSLEENAVLNAKNAFVKRAIDEQIASLETVRRGVEQVGVEGHAEFKSILHTLDIASARLQATLTALRDTIVEPTFRDPTETPKRLYDFVDESGVADLNSSLRACIDRFNAAHATLADTTDAFDGALGGIHHSLASMPTDVNDAEYTEGMNSDERDASPIPSLFRGLEAHATEMANLLQGLVRHYDLCVTALKHTEGGGEAVEQAVGSLQAQEELPEGLGIGLVNVQEDAHPQPMSDEERADMFAILDKDASEVDDVVSEIRDRLSEMEEHLMHVESHVAVLRNRSSCLRGTLKLLSNANNDVPNYITAASEFLAKWEEEKAQIVEKMEELERLRDFYEGFLGAYDGLLVEVARRRDVQRKIERVVQDAMAKIDKLYRDDLEEREAFRSDQGEYLPNDIWPGLINPPVRYEIQAVDSEGAEIPEIRKEMLERALQRIGGRM